MRGWIAGGLASLALAGSSSAQTVGEFAGTWVFNTEVTRQPDGGLRYVFGVMAATHQGGDRYSLLVKAFEPTYGGASPDANFAEQDCTGVVTGGTSMLITCTVKPGASPGYYPDTFRLTRSERIAWYGTMPIGQSAATMSVMLNKVG
jgi:hypothetical protein